MRPNIQLTREVRMRIGNFHVVDALRGVAEGDGRTGAEHSDVSPAS